MELIEKLKALNPESIICSKEAFQLLVNHKSLFWDTGIRLLEGGENFQRNEIQVYLPLPKLVKDQQIAGLENTHNCPNCNALVKCE